jgi:hypothetical protein
MKQELIVYGLAIESSDSLVAGPLLIGSNKMSAVAAEVKVPGTPTRDNEMRSANLLTPASLVPNWVLWTVVLWENYVNLHFNAPYSEDFFTAPLIVAGVKWMMLVAAAWLVTMAPTFKLGFRILLHDLLSFWLLSTAAWSLLVVYYGSLGPDTTEMTDAAAELASNPDPFANFMQGIPSVVVYGLETAIALAFGILLALILRKVALNMRRNIEKHETDLTVTQRREDPNATLPVPRPGVRFLLAAVVYVVCNGVFASVIRIGS